MKTELNTKIKLPKVLDKLISGATDVFTGWIDPDFKNYKLTTDGSRNEQTMEVHELTKSGTFEQIFDSFGRELDDMVVSQSQVIEFAKILTNGDKYDYFFLLKNVGGEFFVARVCFYGDGQLLVYVYRFSFDGVWDAEYRLRIVVPQLDSVSPSPLPSDTLTLESAIKICKENGLEVYKKY